jgi:hypothetical protein
MTCLKSGERELCKGTILYSGTGPFRFSNVLSECWNGWIFAWLTWNT